ncbi:RNA recognition motif-containing protein [Toxoplasma gondii GT1]|uniref:RNA recognition motif-containing protein n=6 Tax=Toxoplasma gondii TaxID=5811 RepID=S7W2V3_TOXGG|nr:RNA recognition motif-containing protein [Toxoplasma gondii GT1]KAF4643962.1 RNA recognition motif-containing protein [Toxoplasma gondii]
MSRSVERNSSPSSGAYQMWLGNIPFDATEEDLKTLLSRVGRVLQVRIKYDEGGQSKGFAFCEFPDPETCYLAYVTLNNADLGGRKLKIDFATDELRQRYGSSGGGAARAERRKAPAGSLAGASGAEEALRGLGTAAGDSLLGPGPGAKAFRGRDTRAVGAVDPRAQGLGFRTRPVSLYDGAAAAADIMEILRTFSTTQLISFLGEMKTLMKEDAGACRRLLSAHPALVYAALHAVYLLGSPRPERGRQDPRSSQRSSSLAPPEKKQKVETETREEETRARSVDGGDLRSLERHMGLPEAQLEKARRNRTERQEQLQHAGLLSAPMATARQENGPSQGRAQGAGDAAPGQPGDGGGFGPQAGGAQLASPLAPEKPGPAGDRSVPGPQSGLAPQNLSAASLPGGQSSSSGTAAGRGLPGVQRGVAGGAAAPQAKARGVSGGAPQLGLPTCVGGALPQAAAGTRPQEESLRRTARQSTERDVSFSARASSQERRRERSVSSGGPPHTLQAAPAQPALQTGTQETSWPAQPGRAEVREKRPSGESQEAFAVGDVVPQHPALAVPPAPDALVEEVLKSPDILTNVLNSRPTTMQDWPQEQRQQVLALQSALLRRGYRVAH